MYQRRYITAFVTIIALVLLCSYVFLYPLYKERKSTLNTWFIPHIWDEVIIDYFISSLSGVTLESHHGISYIIASGSLPNLFEKALYNLKLNELSDPIIFWPEDWYGAKQSSQLIPTSQIQPVVIMTGMVSEYSDYLQGAIPFDQSMHQHLKIGDTFQTLQWTGQIRSIDQDRIVYDYPNITSPFFGKSLQVWSKGIFQNGAQIEIINRRDDILSLRIINTHSPFLSWSFSEWSKIELDWKTIIIQKIDWDWTNLLIQNTNPLAWKTLSLQVRLVKVKKYDFWSWWLFGLHF